MKSNVPVTEVLMAASELIAQGRWDGVTPDAARQILVIQQEIANAINTLEAQAEPAVVVNEEEEENDGS